MSAVLEEHLAYLRLYNRTDLYRAAIAQAAGEGDVVADLGCGVGVLGFMALRAGAARVYGIDHSGAIELARETALRAGLEDRFLAIPGSTFTTDLVEPVDVIVCDHLGYFGFDYGIIGMIADARRRMLKPGGRIVPSAIALSIAGASSAEARGEVDDWAQPRVPGELHWLRGQAVNTIVAHTLAAAAICTDSALAATFDLYADAPEHIATTVSLTASRDARLDGIAGWFDATLVPGITMTNSPLDAGRIARSHAFLPLATPIMVAAGDALEVTLQLRHDPVMLAWSVRHPASGAVQRMSTWKSAILGADDLAPPPDAPPVLGAEHAARLAVLQLVDGRRTAEEIEQELVATRPDLFATTDMLRHFVRRTLGRVGR